nr:hypothetical protein Iba_chr06cCG9190 [Ipomoea batatas]GMD11574.1 hypothetical protein Iba_scaffold40302CG0030 [Ipomoea batatas]
MPDSPGMGDGAKGVEGEGTTKEKPKYFSGQFVEMNAGIAGEIRPVEVENQKSGEAVASDVLLSMESVIALFAAAVAFDVSFAGYAASAVHVEDSAVKILAPNPHQYHVEVCLSCSAETLKQQIQMIMNCAALLAWSPVDLQIAFED